MKRPRKMASLKIISPFTLWMIFLFMLTSSGEYICRKWGRGPWTEGVGDLLLEEPFWGLFPVEWRNAGEELEFFSDIFLLLLRVP